MSVGLKNIHAQCQSKIRKKNATSQITLVRLRLDLVRVPVGIDLMKIGTKWQNEAGTRDHMTKFGWDQGPNGKNS